MSKANTAQFFESVKAHGFVRRSAVYRWMWTNYDDLSELLKKARPSWIVIARELNGIGLRDARGRDLASDNIRRVWLRVSRDLEKERQAARVQQRPVEPVTSAREEPKRFNPSRLPANYRPDVEVRPQPSVPATSGSYQVPASIDVSEVPEFYTRKDGTVVHRTQEQRERIAQQRAGFEKETRHIDRYILTQKPK
ncbi:hypothetical protein [Beijerinckia mobilis]|uniref:hypothetical protein n=1 Tax=Beijerinckia mobilis TaxID=231434 RepID=UPI0009FD14A9|nr:hypothetical protein [Beijerinckia mobilis]